MKKVQKRIIIAFSMLIIGMSFLFGCNNEEIKSIYLYGGKPNSINTYDDVLELARDDFYQYIYRDYDNGWVNIISGNENKYNYSIFDFDNNGIDEIVIYNDYNVILYMFTMYNGSPYCLINSTGEHEIEYSRDYVLVGDSIIEEYVRNSIDSTTYSFYKMENNHLVLIDKIFDGYVDKEDGKYERKVIYTKDGVEKEINRDEMDKIFLKYSSLQINKRKALEYYLKDEPEYLNEKKYIEKVNDDLKGIYDKEFTNFDVDKLLFKLKIKLPNNDRIYKFSIFEFYKKMEYHINCGDDNIAWLNMDSCNLNHNKDDSLTFNYLLIDLNNDGNNELIIFQGKSYNIYTIYNKEVFMLCQFDETHHLEDAETFYDFYDNGMVLETIKDEKWGDIKTIYEISNGQLHSLFRVEYNNGDCMGDYIANENESEDDEKLNKMLQEANKIEMNNEMSFTVYKSFKEQIRLAREYRNLNRWDKEYIVPISFGKYKQSEDDDDEKEIEWYVIKKEDDKALLISKDIIDYKKFDDNDANTTTWRTSSLRKYLNKDFYDNFNYDEKMYILNTKIPKSTMSEFGTDYGYETSDKIFCLSIAECKEYFDLDTFDISGKRNYYYVAEPSKYVKDKGIFVFDSKEYNNNFDDEESLYEYNGKSSFWLRDMGRSNDYAAIYTYFGNCSDYPIDSEIGVRPAMWVCYK